MAEWRSGHQNLRVLYGTAYNVPKLLPGSSYATLRSMFQNVPYYGQAKSVKNVLISTCGADSLHLMKIFLESFLMPKFTYYLLSGHLNTDKKEIRKLVAGRENINLHENVNNMRGLLTGMDIAVSAATNEYKKSLSHSNWGNKFYCKQSQRLILFQSLSVKTSSTGILCETKSLIFSSVG